MFALSRLTDQFILLRETFSKEPMYIAVSWVESFTARREIWADRARTTRSPRGESERAITSRRTAGVRRWGPPLSVGPAGRAGRLRSSVASAGAFPANEAVR